MPAFLPSLISSLPKVRGSRAPPLDLPLLRSDNSEFANFALIGTEQSFRLRIVAEANERRLYSQASNLKGTVEIPLFSNTQERTGLLLSASSSMIA